MSTAVDASQVKELREKSGAGMMDCKRALAETKGDMQAAMELLRKQGIASAEKRAGREASEGLVESYIHPGSRVGVLVEVNCETDFVARTDDFKALARNIAMHIAASAPLAVSREDIPAETVQREREIFAAQAAQTGKPANVVEKIVEGRLEKFYAEVCLLDQAYIKEPERTVADIVKEISGKIGENVVIRRFARFTLGQA
jgi:elongation factor Ts